MLELNFWRKQSAIFASKSALLELSLERFATLFTEAAILPLRKFR